MVGKGGGDFEVYDTRTAQMLRVIRTGKFDNIANMRFSSNGRVLFASSVRHRGLRIYDPYTGDMLRDYDGCMGSFALLPDDRHVLHADGANLRLYDLVANRTFDTPYAQRAHVTRVAVSPDGRHAVVESSDRYLTLWDIVHSPSGVTLSKKSEAMTATRQFPLSAIEFSRTGDFLLTATHEGNLTRRSVPDLKEVQVNNIGRSYASELLRVPDTNRIVVPGMKDEQISHVLFWDLDRDVAATTSLTRVGNGVQLAWSKSAPFLYVASVAGVSILDLPDEKAYTRSSLVVGPLVNPSLAYEVAKAPMLRSIASGATVEAIGVYIGRPPAGEAATVRAQPRPARPRQVDVIVGRSERPSILVLSSYEPVEWRIRQSSDARLRHILLSGYHDSVVVTKPAVEITKIGRVYAYAQNSQEYRGLEDTVKHYLGKGIDRFQGKHVGDEFHVGAVSGSTRSGPDNKLYKCGDNAGRTSYVDRPCSELGLQDRGEVARPPAVSGSRSSNVSEPEPPSQPPRPGRATARSGSGVTISPGPSPHERVIRCGGTTIVCDASDTVICGGKQVPCR